MIDRPQILVVVERTRDSRKACPWRRTGDRSTCSAPARVSRPHGQLTRHSRESGESSAAGLKPVALDPRFPGAGGCNPIPLFRARVSLREDFILKVWAIWRYLLIAWGHWAAAPRPRVGEGAALASGCGHAAAGAVSAAAAAMRRRSVSAQDRLSASACITQTARTFSRPCTRNRVMPRFLMMPCARSVSLRRR